MKGIVGSTLKLSAKVFYSGASTNEKIWVENAVFAI